jgi:hypothetical protein
VGSLDTIYKIVPGGGAAGASQEAIPDPNQPVTGSPEQPSTQETGGGSTTPEQGAAEGEEQPQ